MTEIAAYHFSDLYESLLNELVFNYENIVSPRGLRIKEITNIKFTLLDILNNLFQNKQRKYPEKYLAGELMWYLSGMNNITHISKYSKFWNNIANDDNTANSAYGYLLFKEQPNQWNWAYTSLVNDIDSRQAIMHFNKPWHQIKGIKDFPCTLTGTFQIRNNALNFTVVMRSQDIIKGLTFDLPFFTVLQQCMYYLLLQTYPNLHIGKLTMFVHSLHLYASDFTLAHLMLLSKFEPFSMPTINRIMLDKNGYYDTQYNAEFDKWMHSLL